MRSSNPYSILHLHAEGAAAITHKARPDGSLESKFFYQSPKATGNLEASLKIFFADSRKSKIYINVVSEAATLHTFRDTTLLNKPESFAQVLEANSGIPAKDCDVQFLEAHSGTPFEGKGPLLVNCFKRSDYLRAQAIASELEFEGFELFNNTLSLLGSLTEWRRETGVDETVAVLEVGNHSSTVTLSTADGHIVSKKIPVSVQDIAEGIQKKLELKFESAALLLFYNGIFDFNQHKAAISAHFGAKLAPHLQSLTSKFDVSLDRLLISSLPPSYDWINEEVSSSLNLQCFTRDDFSFLTDLPALGDCATNPGFIGTTFCAHSEPGNHPWMAPLSIQSIGNACQLNSRFATSETVTEEEAYVKALEQGQDPAILHDHSVDGEPIQRNEIAYSSSEHRSEDPIDTTGIFEERETDSAITGDKEEEDPIEVINFNQNQKKDSSSREASKSDTHQEDEETGKRRLGFICGGIAALLILSGSVYLYFQDTGPSYGPAIVPKASPDIAEVSAETPRNLNIEVAEASIPLQTEDEEEMGEPNAIDPLEIAGSSAPELPSQPIIPLGSLLIDSTPSGATVIVNGSEKGTTPITVEELEFGQYAVEFKLNGYVNELLDVSVESEEVQSVSSVLKLPLGTLEIQTTPEGVAFDVLSVEGLDKVIFSGVTPAVIPDVMRGQYDVQFKRDNWDDYAESVTVRYNEVSRVDLVYPEGWLMITSTPDHVSVFEKGIFIGKTPLRLKGLKEGERTYTLRHPGYEDKEMSTEIVAQSEQQLEGNLLSWDREVDYNELDIPPTQLKSTLSYTQRLIGMDSHRFLVEFVINKEGAPEQIEVLETTYLRAHERLKKDISKWLFEPGMRKDRAVRTRVRLPIILGDAKKLPPAVELARTEQEEE